MVSSGATNGARSRWLALSLACLLALSAACESTAAPSAVAPDAQLPDASATDGGSSPTNDAEAGAGDAASVPPVDAAVHDASEPDYSIVALPPTPLGVLAGPYYTPAEGQEALPFYGTDLGVSFTHGNEILILFGDVTLDEFGTPLTTSHDDCQGAISLEDFPDGDAVDAFLDALPASASGPVWSRPAPTLRLDETADGMLAPIELFRGGDPERLVDFGLAKAVVAGFSNNRDGAFGIFRRDVAVACALSTSGTPSCDEGFVCDTEMGFCSNTSGDYPQPCVLGTDRCAPGTCVVSSGGGLCQDRTSSMYKAGDEDGRLESVVIEHELGNAELDARNRYATVPWRTNKFTNPIAKPVKDFDPGRADPDDNDYALPSGSSGREKVLIWGRPHSVGTKAVGRDARLYFAFSDMPERSDAGPVGFNPQYLSALDDDGRPSFSPNPADAIALDLSGDPLPESERYDIVDRTAITYVPSLQSWVMFYGGDFAPAVLSVFVGPNFDLVERAPTGAIHARFARHPWGPWSPPQPVLEAGDPAADPLAADSQYVSGGILHHSRCVGVDCAPSESSLILLAAPDGFLYGPNIFDAFTEVREDGEAVDVYWNVSTWNPYQVMFLRTRLRRER
jgi:hypothetical protein